MNARGKFHAGTIPARVLEIGQHVCRPSDRLATIRNLGPILAIVLIASTGQLLAQTAGPNDEKSDEIRQLEVLVKQLEARVAQLEAQQAKKRDPLSPPVSAPGATASPMTNAGPEAISNQDRSVLDFFHDTTLNLTVDGYYEYNFNRPAGRVNLLRAYDVSSNAFSLNQATVILEQAPDPSRGRRWGARLDLQYGQATETLQGNPANELRPQVYRPVFQAYGTYVVPVGSGLTVDFGKWASALGIESNYSKDQFNYSRSYLFNFLPFYHMGFRTSYKVNDRLTLGYWLVNGAQQAEDFNGFKSHLFGVVLQPRKTVTWTINYYTGQEQRDAVAVLNPGLPAQPGLAVQPVVPTPDGRLHVLDSYVNWNATRKLTLAFEGDYVINRAFHHSPPARVTGGAAYVKYQLTPKAALAGRAEYLSDRGGLFSGITQAVKETTLTYEYKIADGLIARTEWRRDFSNQPFFPAATPGELKKEQNTAALGLIWWWGRKTGSW